MNALGMSPIVQEALQKPFTDIYVDPGDYFKVGLDSLNKIRLRMRAYSDRRVVYVIMRYICTLVYRLARLEAPAITKQYDDETGGGTLVIFVDGNTWG